jgi:hypothetical protein
MDVHSMVDNLLSSTHQRMEFMATVTSAQRGGKTFVLLCNATIADRLTDYCTIP